MVIANLGRPQEQGKSIMSAQKILVVDDNVVIVKAVRMKIAAAGYTVLTASDGGEAIGLVRREKPDLIVLDLSFPPDVGHGGGVAWDGFLIMEWVRRLDEAKDTPIIIITGQDPAKYKDKAMALGAAAFFTKPIDNAGLIEVIRQTLGEKPKPVAS
jgi:CheY-like chemotaxis protein